MNAPMVDPARLPVWEALSDLYLDTDINDGYAAIAEALARSPYSLDAMWRILRDEVHPVLSHNLRSVAGEWTGFRTEWLLPAIRRRLALPRWRRLPGCLFCRYPREQWQILQPLIRAERDNS